MTSVKQSVLILFCFWSKYLKTNNGVWVLEKYLLLDLYNLCRFYLQEENNNVVFAYYVNL